MEGSVYQRKDGRWVGVADVGKDANGKRKQKYVYGKTKKEAQKKINNLVFEIQNNIYRDPENITFYAYLKEWFEINKDKWEDTTAESYIPYLKHIEKSQLCNIKLGDLLPMHLDIFYSTLLKPAGESKGMTVNTVKKIHYFISNCLNYAKKNKLILINPASDIELPESEKYEPKIYTEQEFMQLLSCVEGTDDEIPILLAGAVGLRRGEIFGLRWCDVDFVNERITVSETITRVRSYTVKKPKTQKSIRTIAAPSYVFTVLKAYKEKQKVISFDNDARVFTAYKAGAYSEHFGKLINRLGLPKIRLHDLRHYNAVIMMKYGVPDKVAASRLGHSQVQTLRTVYQHVLTDMDVDAAGKINDMFAKGKSL